MPEQTNLPTTLEGVITERIKPIIGEMIPEEQLRKTVQYMLTGFLNGKSNTGRTPLENLVFAEIERRFTKMISEELSTPEYNDYWDGQRHSVGPKTQEMIRQLVPDIVQAAMQAPFNILMSNLRNQLQTMGRQY